MRKLKIILALLVFLGFTLGISELLSIYASKLNINTATAQELKALPGIGPVIAQRIIEYRNEHGDFKSVEEIKNVPGIGEKRFEKIKDLITVEPEKDK